MWSGICRGCRHVLDACVQDMDKTNSWIWDVVDQEIEVWPEHRRHGGVSVVREIGGAGCGPNRWA